ncbi:MAG: hypothetical protein MZV63_63090 [Marinilabiliales bacterium]|nr:hypothetical protein [Marinilabiliales bacterium]
MTAATSSGWMWNSRRAGDESHGRVDAIVAGRDVERRRDAPGHGPRRGRPQSPRRSRGGPWPRSTPPDAARRPAGRSGRGGGGPSPCGGSGGP